MCSDSTEEARAASFDFSHYNPARESDFSGRGWVFDWGYIVMALMRSSMERTGVARRIEKVG
jgi:hypothetical protein